MKNQNIIEKNRPIQFRQRLRNTARRNLKVPAVNIYETKESYILKCCVPGFNREDFNIEIFDHTLAISAKKTEPPIIYPVIYIEDRCEYDYTTWKRCFKLPEDADELLVNCRYINGELIMRFPRGNSIDVKEPVIVYVY